MLTMNKLKRLVYQPIINRKILLTIAPLLGLYLLHTEREVNIWINRDTIPTKSSGFTILYHTGYDRVTI
jgi:hypothetical protein